MSPKIPTYLIIPAAGKSTRFGLDRPKFLLQHPSGVSMLERSLYGLSNLNSASGIDRIVVVSTRDHFFDTDSDLIRSAIQDRFNVEVEFFFLDSQTGSVVETVFTYLKSLNFEVSVILKDSDNFVGLDVATFNTNENSLAYADLAIFPKVSAPSKSFLEIGSEGIVTNFIEKRVISSYFSVGMTKFARASDMLGTETMFDATNRELYVSDIVRVAMQHGQDFVAHEVSAYEDWGTLADWQSYVSTYKTLFVDVDGVVFENGSRLRIQKRWGLTKPIVQNVKVLLEMEGSGRCQIVFTTARPAEQEPSLREQLLDLGFFNPRIVAGLYHSQRTLINDFAVTNPYPSAKAINIKRDEGNLRDFIA